jgi:hypothetical protein
MKMNKFVVSAAAMASLAGAAQAEDLLLIDLSTPNQITITATTGASAVTTTASNFNGVYMDGFYGGAGAGLVTTLVSGNLTTFANPSDFSPSLFRGVNDPGLNLWSFSTAATVNFTAGQQAFTGSATWTMTADHYANMLAGGTSGNIYADADTVDDISSARLIGQWRVVPTPAALSLLGVGGLVGAARRRR